MPLARFTTPPALLTRVAPAALDEPLNEVTPPALLVMVAEPALDVWVKEVRPRSSLTMVALPALEAPAKLIWPSPSTDRLALPAVEFSTNCTSEPLNRSPGVLPTTVMVAFAAVDEPAKCMAL